MTAAEAIAALDELKPNAFSYRRKLDWLSVLDGRVKKELIERHEGAEEGQFRPYEEGRDSGRQLLIAPPYDQVYLRYMEAQIDYLNGEYERFNNSNAMFAAAYSDFERHYIRTHLPLTEKRSYF